MELGYPQADWLNCCSFRWRKDSAVAFAPDSRKLAAGNLNGEAELWDVATNQQIAPLDVSNPADQVKSGRVQPGRPDGRAGDDNLVEFWDATTGSAIDSAIKLPDTGEVSSMAFSPDGKILATGDSWRDPVVECYHPPRDWLPRPSLQYRNCLLAGV